METLEAIVKRTSTRAYTSKQLSEENLQTILSAGMSAPIGSGLYDSLHITVIQNMDILNTIGNAVTEMVYKKFGKKMNKNFGAPTMIVVSSKPAAFSGIEYANAACVLENMVIAATSLGIDNIIWAGPTAIIAKDEELKKALSIPEGFIPILCASFGYTTEPKLPVIIKFHLIGYEMEKFDIRNQVYVFGFDNTLVNSEDILVQSTAEVLDINLTKDFWYKNLHSVTDVKTEMKILQDEFNIEYTAELQNETGSRFVERLLKTAPNLPILKLLNENIENSFILTGSPIEIVRMYLDTFSIQIPDERLICGIYNGSGEKEKYLKKMQREADVYYIDDDEALIKNASIFVTKVFLVKQPYNTNASALFQRI